MYASKNHKKRFIHGNVQLEMQSDFEGFELSEFGTRDVLARTRFDSSYNSFREEVLIRSAFTT